MRFFIFMFFLFFSIHNYAAKGGRFQIINDTKYTLEFHAYAGTPGDGDHTFVLAPNGKAGDAIKWHWSDMDRADVYVYNPKDHRLAGFYVHVSHHGLWDSGDLLDLYRDRRFIHHFGDGDAPGVRLSGAIFKGCTSIDEANCNFFIDSI